MRRIEVVGLKGESISFYKRTITIQHTVVAVFIKGILWWKRMGPRTRSVIVRCPYYRPLRNCFCEYKSSKRKIKRSAKSSYYKSLKYSVKVTSAYATSQACSFRKEKNRTTLRFHESHTILLKSNAESGT